MEGYLLKKSSERNFGAGWLTDKKKSWNRRWFVLEDQTVTYYEDFDVVTGEPVREKGKLIINGCEILPVSHNTKKFIFCVKEGNKNLLYLQAEDAKMLGLWMRAMSAAANGDYKAPALDYNLYYRRLRLDPLVEYEPSAINRAFRTLATYSDPENGGGNPKEFKELQEAFNHIMAQLNDREEARLYKLAFYEAVIIKGGRGEGMGIVVQEEADRRNIVKAVKDSLRIKSITGEVGEDGIQEGDQLMKIGNTDVSKMPLIRIAQRMNDFRIPPNAMVRLTFGRKVPREYVLEQHTYGDFGDLNYSQDEQDQQYEHQYQQQEQQEYYEDDGDQEYEEVEEVPGPQHGQQEPEYTRAQDPPPRGIYSANSTNSANGADFRAPLDSPGTYSTRESLSQRQLSGNINSTGNTDDEADHGRAQNVQPAFTSSGSSAKQASRPSSANMSTRSAPPPPVQVQHYESVSPLSSPGGVPSLNSPNARPMSLPVNSMRSGPAPMAARPTTTTRHGSIASPVVPSKPTSAPVLSPSVTSVASPPGVAKPLTAQVDAIQTKDYFYRNSLQMKSPAEIAEMKRDLDFCLKEMQVASKRIEDLEFHNAQLEDELTRYKALYADSARHERLLETQLEQYLIHSTVTAEFMEESMNDMITVSEQIAANVPIPVSDQTNTYLEQVGLGEDESELDGSKASQRNAIAATAAMDRSGLMLQKWAMTGDSILDKLSRFEERVQRMDSIHLAPGSAPRPASPQRQSSFYHQSQQQQAPYGAQQSQGQSQGQGQGGGSVGGNSASYKQPQQYRQGNSTSPLRRSMSAQAPGPSSGASIKGYQRQNPASPTAPGPAGRPPASLSPAKAATDPQAAQLSRGTSQQASGWANAPHAPQAPISPTGRAPLSRSATVSGGAANFPISPTQQQQQQVQAPMAERLLAKSYSLRR